jgi:SPP1 gp7 family putative phage head morphogenesis protein
MRQVRAEVDHAIDPTALEHVAGDFGRRVSAHQLGEIQRQSKAALGVDVVFHDPKVQPLISGFIHENVSLIRKLQGSTLDELEVILARAVSDGTRAEAIAEQIGARFGVSERHARLISLDQVGKLNSKITEARHTELGIKSYDWVSLLVGKRRPEHVARHGKPFRYDRPPADGHPGMAICCRCLQQPVFDDIYAELDALGV